MSENSKTVTYRVMAGFLVTIVVSFVVTGYNNLCAQDAEIVRLLRQYGETTSAHTVRIAEAERRIEVLENQRLPKHLGAVSPGQNFSP